MKLSARLPVILFADRNPFVVQQVKKALGDLADIVIASNGFEALDSARALKPEILITEVLLPEFDGYQLCRRLRDDPLTAGIRVIVVSALNSAEVAFRAGASAFLVKPIDMNQLRKTVVRFLTQRKTA